MRQNPDQLNSKIPVFLITGFLGSGKTTFINQLLKNYSGDFKIGVIQNEFAPAHVDSELLRQSGYSFDILEVNNGSIFCICLLGDFIKSMNEFVKKSKPQLVFIEASGLSDPYSITEILQEKTLSSKVYMNKIWTIVDASNFFRIEKLMSSVAHQIILADHVILNKTDRVNQQTYKEITTKIREMNPMAEIHQTSYCRISTSDLATSGDVSQGYQTILNENEVPHMEGRPDIRSGVFKSGRKVKAGKIRTLIGKYARFTMRIKGHVETEDAGTLLVQSVFDNVDIRKSERPIGNTALVFLGENFN